MRVIRVKYALDYRAGFHKIVFGKSILFPKHNDIADFDAAHKREVFAVF